MRHDSIVAQGLGGKGALILSTPQAPADFTSSYMRYLIANWRFNTKMIPMTTKPTNPKMRARDFIRVGTWRVRIRTRAAGIRFASLLTYGTRVTRFTDTSSLIGELRLSSTTGPRVRAPKVGLACVAEKPATGSLCSAQESVLNPAGDYSQRNVTPPRLHREHIVNCLYLPRQNAG